jgi:hypothetical protein
MGMKNYLFLTAEGYTFQPRSESIEPNIENLQVLGFVKGTNSEEAFYNLVKNNEYLLKTTFEEVFCYELPKNYQMTKAYYNLRDFKKKL